MAIDALGLPRAKIVEALDELGIPTGWEIGTQLRLGVELAGLDRKATQVAGFRNQVVGRIAERVFRDQHLAILEPEFEIIDYHAAGEHRDYGVNRDGHELPINVKTASTLFRNAKNFGLDPEDCIPISSYKALGAVRRVPDLVYVDLVDFTLRERADRVIEGLTGSYAILWDLFSWYGGKGAKAAQDAYVDRLFDHHGSELDALAPGVTQFRVISAQRVLAILRDIPTRVPGLGVKAAGTGSFVAEVNVHVSVGSETVPWDDVADLIRDEGIQAALDLIRATEEREIPSPLL